MAYGKHIHVYVPQFPTQAIGEKPALVFTSHPSDMGLRGFLDPRHPHAINSLLVQDLGNEEVVAVVRDDGDVDAFLVRHVVQAIERRAASGNMMGVVADEVRPIFQDNVESSAWGLAIHSQARILATSSNKHEVRIFKFGLISDGATSRVDEAYQDGSEDSTPGSREEDVTLHVINGNANIPYIAFCNTGDDPHGRWLLTTDVGGFCRVMDLQRSTCSQTFRFGQSFAAANIGGFDRLNAGWTIMFLDRRSFQSEPSMAEALGMDGSAQPPIGKDQKRIWDISKTTKELLGASEPFVPHRPRRRNSTRPQLDIRSPSGQSTASSTADSQDSSTRPSTASEPSGPLEIEIDVDVSDNDSTSSGGVDIEVGHEVSGGYNDDDVLTIAPMEGEDLDAEESDGSEWQIGVVDDDHDPEDEGTEDTVAFTSFYNGDSVCGNEPRFARVEDGSLCDDLPCPILHTSVRNIYLLQPSNQQDSEGPWIPPMVGLANPLRQPIQHDFEYLRMFERLNMCAQIPALGVVVVASQKGRALVLSLSKVPADAVSEPQTRDRSYQQSTYAMRVECILPFFSQERENQRPFAPLHGLAVGPMQGSERPEKAQRRWRVMLMYQDHSILSYEISRRASNRDSAVDVDSLVV